MKGKILLSKYRAKIGGIKLPGKQFTFISQLLLFLIILCAIRQIHTFQ